jgi:hypothetical protein
MADEKYVKSPESSEWGNMNSEEESVRVTYNAIIVFLILYWVLFYLATHVFNQTLKL